MAPFLLVYGHPPIEPLSPLRWRWEDEVIILEVIEEFVADCMQKLGERLKEAAEYADSIDKSQKDNMYFFIICGEIIQNFLLKMIPCLFDAWFY